MSGVLFACKKSQQPAKSGTGKTTTTTGTKMGAAPATWQEHWFAHNKLLDRVYDDDDPDLYYDDGMDPTIQWDRSRFTLCWQYIKKNYGTYGDSSRLYVVLHGILPNTVSWAQNLKKPGA